MFDLGKKFVDKNAATKQALNPQCRIFALQHHYMDFHIRYTGWREVLVLDYKKSAYIRCALEFEWEYIPVIDPDIWFRGKPTPVSSSACILVVEHSYEYQKLRTGIIISDINEVINLAAGNLTPKTKQLSYNMQFALKLPKKTKSNRLLNFSHLELLWCEKQKQADEDFAAFEKKLQAKISCNSPSPT